MLPKAYQANSAEITLVREEGRFFNSPFFGVLTISLNSSSPPKLAFVVSKKISKKAVSRNRLKRLLREAVKQYLPKFPPGVIILFLAKRNLLDKTFAEIQKEICLVFTQNGLLQ